jgi:small basic protein
MNTWEAITGIILLIVGLGLLWQSYTTSTNCNSISGRVWTAISSMFGGTNAQACYNASIIEVGSVITAIIGLVIIYAAVKGKRK